MKEVDRQKIVDAIRDLRTSALKAHSENEVWEIKCNNWNAVEEHGSQQPNEVCN